METRAEEAGREARLDVQSSGGLWPGAVLGGLIALASGAAFFSWGLPTLGEDDRNAGVALASELDEVGTSDLAGAVSTLDIPANLRARVDDRVRRCTLRLAWVSVASGPGQTGATVRLQSGNYYSPSFRVGPHPVRFAIPFPESYAEGHGTIGAFVAGGVARIGLTPAWSVAGQSGESFRNVSWRPVACPNAHG